MQGYSIPNRGYTCIVDLRRFISFVVAIHLRQHSTLPTLITQSWCWSAHSLAEQSPPEEFGRGSGNCFHYNNLPCVERTTIPPKSTTFRYERSLLPYFAPLVPLAGPSDVTFSSPAPTPHLPASFGQTGTEYATCSKKRIRSVDEVQ